jgi:protein-disulfide isomerase
MKPPTTMRAMTMRPSSLALLVALSALSACYRSAHDPALDKRLDAIEQRLAAQDKAITELKTTTGSTELSLLAQQNAELAQKVADLDAKVGKAPSPRRPARVEPDKDLVYSVPLGTSPAFGPTNAKVTMVMAFDFACPYCRRAWDTVDALQAKYGKDLRVVYKHLIVHPSVATTPAFAACAANHQKKFRELSKLLWTKAFDVRDFDQENIDALAKEARLDMSKYKADVAGICKDEIRADQDLMKKLAVNATPSFFINGRYLAGALPQAQFEALIDEELAKANAAINGGVKADRYYEDEIVAKGLKDVR